MAMVVDDRDELTRKNLSDKYLKLFEDGGIEEMYHSYRNNGSPAFDRDELTLSNESLARLVRSTRDRFDE